MKVSFSSLAAGGWFKAHNRLTGEMRLHCRSSTDKVLTFYLGGNFITDAWSFRKDDFIEPVTVQVRIVGE